VASGGTAETSVGTDTQLGNVWSRGTFTLHDRGHVNGFVRGGSNVTTLNGASIAGTVLKHASLNLIPLDRFQVTFPSLNPGDVSLEPPPSSSAQRVLDPGPYGNLMAKKLSLRAGVCSFASFDIEPSATLSLDTSAGPIVVPNAGLTLASTSVGHIGSFFGKDVELRPQTNVQLEAFNYPWIP
jgi:hypothetical protein